MAKVEYTEEHYAYWVMQWQRRREKPLESLKKAIKLFRELDGDVIVEIGSQRNRCNPDDKYKDCCIDGHSSELFAKEDAAFYTCDINPEATRLVHEILTEQDLMDRVNIFTGDGIEFLERAQFTNKIDLLYLDAWDVTPGTPYAQSHLTAFLTAQPKLNDKHIILIDDTDIAWTDTHGFEIDKAARAGKGELLVPILLSKGYKLRWEGRQACLTNY